MLQYADKALRLEVTVCSRALREWQINMPCNWSLDTGKLILLDHIGNLEMNNNFRLDNEVLNTLGSRMKMAYLAWWHGEDLRNILSKPTFTGIEPISNSMTLILQWFVMLKSQSIMSCH